MTKIQKLKTYLTAPGQCFIPRCKAHCCTNAPLPEDFLPRFESRIQRPIYSGVNIGKNDPRDTYNSVVYNTSPNPIQILGIDQHGHPVMGIPKELLEKLQIKSMQQINELMARYSQYDNYCPFITKQARCVVYEHRPPICREFGTAPGRMNICPDKSSRLDIIKFFIKNNLFNFKRTFKILKESIKTKSS